MTQVRKGKHADLVIHSALFGRMVRKVREFSVSDVKPCAQYETSVTISFTEPRKRNGLYKQVLPTSIEFVTIEHDGAVLYDSRLDVPCDMEKVNRLWAEHQQHHRTQVK